MGFNDLPIIGDEFEPCLSKKARVSSIKLRTELRIENGEWRMENGEWRIAKGRIG